MPDVNLLAVSKKQVALFADPLCAEGGINPTALDRGMMIQKRDFAIMLGGGVSLGLGVVSLGGPAELPTTLASGEVGPQGRYTPELLAAREQYLAAKAHDEEWEAPPIKENPAKAPSVRDPAQQIANAILSNPNATMSDIAMALDILNGRSSRYMLAPVQSVSPPARQGSYRGRSGLPLRYGSMPAQRAVNEAYDTGPASVGYRGASGASYQYDLSDPGQQLHYDMDPMAQMQDSISIDPRRTIDRSLGQNGAGIER